MKFETIEINDTTFSGNKLINEDTLGGVIYSMSSAGSNSSYIKIINSIAYDNNAFKGGFLYADTFFIEIISSNFFRNIATSDGGALYITV